MLRQCVDSSNQWSRYEPRRGHATRRSKRQQQRSNASTERATATHTTARANSNSSSGNCIVYRSLPQSLLSVVTLATQTHTHFSSNNAVEQKNWACSSDTAVSVSNPEKYSGRSHDTPSIGPRSWPKEALSVFNRTSADVFLLDSRLARSMLNKRNTHRSTARTFTLARRSLHCLGWWRGLALGLDLASIFGCVQDVKFEHKRSGGGGGGVEECVKNTRTHPGSHNTKHCRKKLFDFLRLLGWTGGLKRQH